MNKYRFFCVIAFFFLMTIGCQKEADWTQVTPYDKELLDQEFQEYIDIGLLVEAEVWGDSGLADAQSPEDFALVIEKMPHGIESRTATSYSQTIFGYATLLGRNASSIEYLLDQGANVDQRDFQGATPLHAAIGQGNIEMVRILLELGADPNAADIYGYAPLFTMSIFTPGKKLEEMYSILIENDADPHVYRVVDDGSDEYPTPYDCLRYRAKKRDSAKAALLLEVMDVPPSNLTPRP